MWLILETRNTSPLLIVAQVDSLFGKKLTVKKRRRKQEIYKWFSESVEHQTRCCVTMKRHLDLDQETCPANIIFKYIWREKRIDYFEEQHSTTESTFKVGFRVFVKPCGATCSTRWKKAKSLKLIPDGMPRYVLIRQLPSNKDFSSSSEDSSQDSTKKNKTSDSNDDEDVLIIIIWVIGTQSHPVNVRFLHLGSFLILLILLL